MWFETTSTPPSRGRWCRPVARRRQSATKKTDAGVAWGSVHWQYLEDMSKVTSYEGTPLKLTKQLYTKQHTKKRPVLEPVKGPVAAVCDPIPSLFFCEGLERWNDRVHAGSLDHLAIPPHELLKRLATTWLVAVLT